MTLFFERAPLSSVRPLLITQGRASEKSTSVIREESENTGQDAGALSDRVNPGEALGFGACVNRNLTRRRSMHRATKDRQKYMRCNENRRIQRLTRIMKLVDIPKPAQLGWTGNGKDHGAGVRPRLYDSLRDNNPLAEGPLVLGNKDGRVVEAGGGTNFHVGVKVSSPGGNMAHRKDGTYSEWLAADKEKPLT